MNRIRRIFALGVKPKGQDIVYYPFRSHLVLLLIKLHVYIVNLNKFIKVNNKKTISSLLFIPTSPLGVKNSTALRNESLHVFHHDSLFMNLDKLLDFKGIPHPRYFTFNLQELDGDR